MTGEAPELWVQRAYKSLQEVTHYRELHATAA